MKFSNSLSSRLLLALSLTVPSVFLTNAVKAETVQPKPIVQVNQLQNPVKFSPNLGEKLDVLRYPGAGVQPPEAFDLVLGFTRSFSPDTDKLSTQPDVQSLAVDTFRSLNKTR